MKLMLNGEEVKGVGFHVTAGDIKDATTEPEEVLSGQYFYNNEGRKTGTMPNRGAVSAALNAGESVAIPKGYHNGEGKVTANSLASQVSEANFGNATAADVASGKTFTSAAGLKATGSYTPPTLASQTPGTAAAADIASGKTAWVNGVKVTGASTAKATDFDDIRMEEEQMLDLTGYTYAGYTNSNNTNLTKLFAGKTYIAIVDLGTSTRFQWALGGSIHLLASTANNIIKIKVGTSDLTLNNTNCVVYYWVKN